MKYITQIKLSNFKKFQDFKIDLNDGINVLIGDNEAGKSSLLTAVDLVLSGSKSKFESIGTESLLNVACVQSFMDGEKVITKLPKMYVEVYLNEQENADLCGKGNSQKINCDGLRLVCEPSEDYHNEIAEILEQPECNFPFEYYSVKFVTFSGEAYTGYKKFLKHILIDGSQINNEYAAREYIRSMYSASTNSIEKHKFEYEYRTKKTAFKNEILEPVNRKLGSFQFAVKTSSKSNLESDLDLVEDGISIENKGKGRQCFIKTEFALRKNDAGVILDLLLLEEPENHLSHVNMKKLIQQLSSAHKNQILIATHSNMICTRLNLRNAVMLGATGSQPAFLKDLSTDTANFFMKAPDNCILEFILSKKVILVEGDAEFILMDALYKKITGGVAPEENEIHIISIGGTSFKRYMELGKLLNIKTAAIRDNDKNYEKNCVENYKDEVTETIKVFADRDDKRSTFEICVYEDNRKVCDDLWAAGRRALTVQEYMLSNKADVAFTLLDKKANELVVPKYIEEAIQWIRA